MTKETLYEAIGGISDAHITEAREQKRAGKSPVWIKWGAVAACAALVIGVGVRLLPQEVPDDTQLPLLTIPVSDYGMGFEGLNAYDISELVDANPWSADAGLTRLPVYQNQLSYDTEFGVISGDDPAVMQAALLEIAGRLGMDTANLTIQSDAPGEEYQAQIRESAESAGVELPEGFFDPKMFMAEDENWSINVDTALTVSVSFKEAVALPEEYNFTHRSSSYEDMRAVAGYLRETYRSLIGMEDPQISITGGDYDTSLQQGYQIGFYDGSGSLTDRVVNYNFNQVEFYCDSEGRLDMIRFYRPDLSGLLGEYPIITADEAQTLLQNGNYITSVTQAMPGEEYIAKVELVYRTGAQEECYLPYYRFYVELPDAPQAPAIEQAGLKTYGAYYVPAVEGTYLANMPLWDGSFN